MSQSFLREFKLARREGDGQHPYLNADGAFIGQGMRLLAKDSFGDFAPAPQGRLEAILSAGYGVRVDLASRMNGLAALAEALNQGDPARAAILLVQLQFPALPDKGAAARMSKASGLLDEGASAEEVLAKLPPDRGMGKANPNHRGPGPGGGQFTSGDDAGAASGEAGADAGGATAPGKSYVTALTADQIIAAAMANKATPGWLQPSDVNPINKYECVSLVRAVFPHMPHSPDWKQGEMITLENAAGIPQGTAIATFENGRYANAGTGNHAAIFFGPDIRDGQTVGIMVVDQSKQREAELHALPFYRPPGQEKKYKAGDFSVISR